MVEWEAVGGWMCRVVLRMSGCCCEAHVAYNDHTCTYHILIWTTDSDL